MSGLEEDARAWLAHAVIIEFEAEDIRQVKDDLVFRVIGLGCRDVGLDAVDFLVCPLINKEIIIWCIWDRINDKLTLGCALMANAYSRRGCRENSHPYPYP